MAPRAPRGRCRLSSSPPPTWIEAAFAAALEVPPEDRPQLLRILLADAEARSAVERLLRRHEALETSGDVFLKRLDPVAAGQLLDALSPTPALIGRYAVERRLARGGHGIVYLARDPALGRQVAIKVLPPGRSRRPAARAQLEAEARSLSALDHPHIATIHEIGEGDEGELFFVMAYYPGGTLRARLARGPLPIRDAIRIGLEVAQALAAAHQRGIVHRDLKPENVILTEHGARLVDFGIAAAVAGDADPAGTLPYMSPEQLEGASADPRADVWALGVLLYEMLAGRRPFEGAGRAALLAEIRNAPPAPLAARRRAVPRAFLQTIEQCLRPDPAERPVNAAPVAARLAAVPASASRLVASAALAVIAVAAAVVAVRAPRDNERARVAAQLVALGSAALDRGTPESREEAAGLFRQAIGRDSTSVDAYVGLATVIARSPAIRPADRYARLLPLLHRASALDPGRRWVEGELGWTSLWYARDYVEAERHLRRALELDPTNPWRYHYYAAWLSVLGRLEEAVWVEQAAMAVDPRGAATVAHVGMHLTRLGRVDEAIAVLERLQATDSSFPRTPLILGRAYLAKGRYREALREFRRSGSDYVGLEPEATIAYILGKAGARTEAEAITNRYEERATREWVNPADLALCYLGLGRRERALDWIERIPEERGLIVFLNSDPIFAELAGEPRFQQVMAQLGLDSASVARVPDTRAAIEAILRPDGRLLNGASNQGS